MIDPLTLQDCKVRIAQGLAKIIISHCTEKSQKEFAAFIAENIELDPIIDYYEAKATEDKS